MNEIIEEVLEAAKGRLSDEELIFLKNILIVKFNGYKITKEETNIVKYEATDSEIWFKKFFVTKTIQGLSNRTLKYYKSELTRIFKIINKPLDKITADDLRYYLACWQTKKKLSPNAVDNTRRILSTFFKFLEDEEYIKKNPVKKIKKVRSKKMVKKALNTEELDKLRIQCEKITDCVQRKRGIALLETLLSTGARVSEISHLKIEDINFVKSEALILGKGNKERIVYLNSTAKLRIQEYLNVRKGDCEYLFSSIQRPYKRLETSAIEIFIRKLGRSAGVENVHPHRFRRTCATILNRRGMPIGEIAKYLGHDSIATTQIYVDVNGEDVRRNCEKFLG